MVRSPCRKDATSIVLPRIPKGVQATPNLLRYVEILWYSDHDVANAGKFLEFAQHVYTNIIGTRPFENPILQPKAWEVSLANIGILILVEVPHFGRGKEVNKYIK